MSSMENVNAKRSIVVVHTGILENTPLSLRRGGKHGGKFQTLLFRGGYENGKEKSEIRQEIKRCIGAI
jgi:hypothetical protein